MKSPGGCGLRSVASIAKEPSGMVAMHRLICLAQFFKRKSPIAVMISKRAEPNKVQRTNGAFAGTLLWSEK